MISTAFRFRVVLGAGMVRVRMVKLALSTLCEDPGRPTGLSTLFPALVTEARRCFPEIEWLVFAGPGEHWSVADAGVEVVRRFPANNLRLRRLWADHFRVGPCARSHGASALVTVGFVPVITAGLPVAMHVLSLHHRGAMGAVAWYRAAALATGFRRAALVIANSRWTASQLEAPAGRVLISPEGIDHLRFRPDGPRGGGTLPSDYLLWTGNFYGYKRAELALAAYARLPEPLRVKFPFLMAGGDWRGGRDRAAAVARALGIEANVKFLGWVADASLPALYRGARATIVSSAEETFGRSVTEAMACGCPCVLQDLPVLREVTAGNALFCDFASGPAAGRALQSICTDDALAARLRGAGLLRAADFSFQQLARERVGAILAAVTGR